MAQLRPIIQMQFVRTVLVWILPLSVKAGLTLGFRILYESDFSMKKGSVFGAKCFVSMILKGLKSIKNRQLQLFVCMRPEW